MKRNLLQLCLLGALALQTLTSAAQPVTQIAGGRAHTLFLKSDGSLWATGDNSYGQLGDGTYISTNRPKRIATNNVTAVAAGYKHSLFLKSDGSLWAMGNNTWGQLGDSTPMNAVSQNYGQTNVPEQIVAGGVRAIAAGSMYSLFLKSDGSLWAMGNNGNGQLGTTNLGDLNHNINIPQLIVASNVTAIAAGDGHSLFLENDGSLWGMGNNASGELGYGSFSDLSHPLIPVQIMVSNVTAIAAGGSHSLLLKRDGSLWAMGKNDFGELGDSTYVNTNRAELIVASNVVSICAGTEHSLFLQRDGSLWAMGHNQCGQLGYGATVGAGNCTNRTERIITNGVTALATRLAYSSFFMRNFGSLWATGNNESGELGDGTINVNGTNQPEQIVAGVPGYNLISAQPIGGGTMQLSFVGIAGANYALDRSASLAAPIWQPQATNPANAIGALSFTNTPDATTNNFWRIRSVP